MKISQRVQQNQITEILECIWSESEKKTLEWLLSQSANPVVDVLLW